MSPHAPPGAAPALHALLIGVDCYLPNRLPNGVYYPSLRGCVRDVGRVAAFLRTRAGVPAERIWTLTATNDGAGRPAEPAERWPTYANMVAGFRRVAAGARPGDQVYVHYSGHGGRSPTILPALKGEGGLDESLVPVDIGRSEARYLRDVEIARLLEEMADAGLVVTLVLDCCHSGGATRGDLASGAVPRGIGVVDGTPRPAASLAGTSAELAATWGALAAAHRAGATRAGAVPLDAMPSGATRALQGGGGWLPDVPAYTLLAACRPSESANETLFDGVPGGVLTYWLLDALEQAGPGLTFKQLHDRLVAKVHSQFERQTPQLDGDGARVVFGTARALPAYSALVLGAPDDGAGAVGAVLTLAAGQAHGIRVGAQFAVYPLYATDFSQGAERLALAEVTEVGATESQARVTHRLRAGDLAPGAPAVLVDPGAVRLRRRVRLVAPDPAAHGVDAAAALAAVATAVAHDGSGWVEVAPSGDAADGDAADYQVALDARGAFAVLDAAGEPVANLRPPLPAGDPASARVLARRLVHLARYRAVQQLDNADPTSPLAGALEAELTGVQPGFTPGKPAQPVPFAEPGHTPTLRDGTWVLLRLRNASDRVLNVSVLNLRGDWGVGQIFPGGAGNWFRPLDPGERLDLPLRASLPAGYAAVRDLVKVFATVGPTDFRQLELPALDRPPLPVRRTRSAAERDILDPLLEAVTADRPGARTLTAAAYPSHGWTSVQLELRVAAPEADGAGG